MNKKLMDAVVVWLVFGMCVGFVASEHLGSGMFLMMVFGYLGFRLKVL